MRAFKGKKSEKKSDVPPYHLVPGVPTFLRFFEIFRSDFQKIVFSKIFSKTLFKKNILIVFLSYTCRQTHKNVKKTNLCKKNDSKKEFSTFLEKGF
jgi:hypothetical protein